MAEEIDNSSSSSNKDSLRNIFYHCDLFMSGVLRCRIGFSGVVKTDAATQ